MLTLALLALLQDPTAISLQPPEKVSAADVKAAATVVESRCKAYGYDDVTAVVVQSKPPAKLGLVIEIRRKDGFTQPMQERIRRTLIHTYTGTGETLVAEFHATQVQLEMFPEPEPDKAKQAKAPPGAEWTSVTNQSLAVQARLIHKGSRFDAADFIPEKYKRKDGKESIRWVMNEAAVARWDKLPEKVRTSEFLIPYCPAHLNTRRTLTDETVAGVRRVYTDAELEPEILILALHPLPKSFQPQPEKKTK